MSARDRMARDRRLRCGSGGAERPLHVRQSGPQLLPGCGSLPLPPPSRGNLPLRGVTRRRPARTPYRGSGFPTATAKEYSGIEVARSAPVGNGDILNRFAPRRIGPVESGMEPMDPHVSSNVGAE